MARLTPASSTRLPASPTASAPATPVDAAFLPQGGIDSVTQLGNVAYTDGQPPDKRMQAWANSARYTPADQMLVLTGSPRVTNGGMATTAKTIRMNRATGDALAEGRRQEHLQRTEGTTGRRSAGIFFADPRHRAQHDRPQHSRDGPLLGKRPPLAGRQHYRGADHPVRPRPSIRHRPRHAGPARADDSGPDRRRPEAGTEPVNLKQRGKEDGERARPLDRIEPHLHHRCEAHLRGFRAQSPLRRRGRCQGRRLHRIRQEPPTPTCYPAVKPRIIKRLPAPASSTTWSPKTTLSSSSPTAEPKVKTWFTPPPTTSSS